MELRRGFEVKKGVKIIIVEDVVIIGKLIMEIKRVLEVLGGEVVGVVCIVDRINYDIGMFIYSVIKFDI